VEGVSDAARSAAAAAFLDEGLGTIITGIKVARQILHGMKVYVVYFIVLCIQFEVYLMQIRDKPIRVGLICVPGHFFRVCFLACGALDVPGTRASHCHDGRREVMLLFSNDAPSRAAVLHRTLPDWRSMWCSWTKD